MRLTREDIAALKYERRFGYLFPALILAFAILLNAFYFIVVPLPNLIYVIFTDTAVILICLLINYRVSHKLKQDLKDGVKVSKKAIVQDKECKVLWEAGSGTLHIPVLGNLFPKVWGQKMRDSSAYYLIINNTRYEVDRKLYEDVNPGDTVIMYYAQYSNSRLGIEKSRYPYPEM